ncbi:hypothetical protein NEOLI_001601 [Neolecta irregularis DAH-3]|uniref:Uncharacterized protein n=1 Tax=Neolecta irregularis (strain DAH-3) TaxID=1198029 RepID=A0A1U7LR21_NEOID|nr:hypothetical protein NEOLI_001601 [Neolecta irregularis DAH-3]|eukprot:OLL25079.1 hypothetical protein NEOLI_001601 [Neolecta irregularis DAH-3]
MTPGPETTLDSNKQTDMIIASDSSSAHDARSRTEHDTGFKEPFSSERNTTLPTKDAKADATIESHVSISPNTEEATGHKYVRNLKTRIKADIKMMEGKILQKPELIEGARALKSGEIQD